MSTKKEFTAQLDGLPIEAVERAYEYLGEPRVSAALGANETPVQRTHLLRVLRLWVYASMPQVQEKLSKALGRPLAPGHLYPYIEKGYLSLSLKAWVEEDHLEIGEWSALVLRDLLVPVSQLRSRASREHSIECDTELVKFAFRSSPRRVFRLSIKAASSQVEPCVFDLAKSTDSIYLAAVLTGTAASIEKSLEAHDHRVKMKAAACEGAGVKLTFKSESSPTTSITLTAAGKEQMLDVFLDEHMRLGLGTESFIPNVQQRLQSLQSSLA